MILNHFKSNLLSSIRLTFLSVRFKHSYVLGLRREDQSPWERRTPLAPQHVRKLVKDNVKVLIQASNRRAYPTAAYIQAGAIVQEDLSEASLILGVKQPPVDLIIPNKVYTFFSHTHKAQEANMSLLDACIEKNITLIDYERIVDDDGVRLVAFGKYAGVVGMINILHAMGLRFLALGHHTPFMHIGPAHNYRNNEQARMSIRDAGYEISLGLMPKSIGPLTIVFTGSGNVSQGAQEVFRELPFEYVEADALKHVAVSGDIRKIYGCIIKRKDHLVNKETGKYDADEFVKYPERYTSIFKTNIAPFASVIINGIYWEQSQPKLLRIADAKVLLAPSANSQAWLPTENGCPVLPHRLLSICDITADKGGSIEFVTQTTTIDHPFLLYDPHTQTAKESFNGPGVLICSIDNMPTQLPLEATEYFGSLLFPLIPTMLQIDATKEFQLQNIPRVIKDAVLTANGHLTPKYSYITQLREQRRIKQQLASTKKRVLILGSGFVSAPAVECLTRDNNISVTLVSSVKLEADRLADLYPNTTPVMLDIMRSSEEVEKLIKDHDIVVSLLPFSHHSTIAELCIKHHRNLVTTSYVSPKMKLLHDAAKQAGCILLNEVGLDPGIDHMLAMDLFDHVKDDGGSIQSYVSYCGGLPAPEHADNSLRYKFSWSPRGVLSALLNQAKYMKNGKIIELEGNGGVIENGCHPAKFLHAFNLECYPNRDSIQYIDSFQLNSVHTILRGTLRYKGFCQGALGLIKLGLLSDREHPHLRNDSKENDLTWKQFMCDLVDEHRSTSVDNLKNLISNKLNNEEQLHTIEDLGLLSDDIIDKRENPLDTLSNYLSKRLAYGPNERDIVIMYHEVGIKWPQTMKSKSSEEIRTIEMVIYGDNTKSSTTKIEQPHSAMAKTVGLPAAIATKMLLEKEIHQTGVVVPIKREIYKPILERLKKEGIRWTEKSKTIH